MASATRTRPSEEERREQRVRQRFARRQWARRWMHWRIVVAVLGVVGVAVFASVRPRILDARLIEDEELQDELSDLAGGPR